MGYGCDLREVPGDVDSAEESMSVSDAEDSKKSSSPCGTVVSVSVTVSSGKLITLTVLLSLISEVSVKFNNSLSKSMSLYCSLKFPNRPKCLPISPLRSSMESGIPLGRINFDASSTTNDSPSCRHLVFILQNKRKVSLRIIHFVTEKAYMPPFPPN